MATELFMRSFALEDIAIRKGGDGRTVEAYATVFDTPAEIRDGQGHYMETIDRAAFNKTLADHGTAFRVGVFYNHGMNLYGQPSDRYSMPVGTPIDIRADARGLLTVTRYNATPQGDEVLEVIKSGGMAGYSFTGRMIRSNPVKAPRGGYRPGANGLQTVVRHELGLEEYGPTPMPAYSQAAIVGVRAALREELLNMLSPTSETEPEEITDTSDTEAVADEPQEEHSRRQTPFERRLAVALTARGIRSE